MKKRFIICVLIMVMAMVIITPAFAIVEQTSEFYVADYANVLSNETEQKIIEANAVLENTCNGAQIVVVAVEYLDGLYADEYALQVMNDWGVGSKTENNGMVLLFATKENKGGIAIGDGIDGVFTMYDANEYLEDYFWKQYDRGNYDKAVQNLFPELVEWYEDNYDVNMYMGDPYYNESYGSSIDFGAIFIIVIFLAIFILVAIMGSRQHYRAYYVHMGMPIPRFHIWHMWSGPHRHWHDPHQTHYHNHYYHNNYRGPRGPHGPGGFGGHGGGSFGGRGGFGGGMGRGGGGRSGGGFGGRR